MPCFRVSFSYKSGNVSSFSRAVPAAAGAPGEIEGLVVAAGDGAGLELVQVQPEGRGPQPAAAWANGARPQPGERLGE
jgi:methionyl-tRNA formyltransferase